MDARLQERYSRQILFAEIGEQGQERLRQASAVVVGCGALGTALANLLVRGGIGGCASWTAILWSFRICSGRRCSRKSDAHAALPKAVAAEQRLAAINSDVRVEGVVADLNPDNIEESLGGFPLLLDGTDNFETRLLLNDYAVRHNVPWVYAAVVSSYGVTMPIRPGRDCLPGVPD
jgi:molybdopterin/thiamine biosynthesis adenylyltransferase